jgi:dimethylargininase
LFNNAIVRVPGKNFADGLTTVSLGVPRLDVVLQQHASYCAVLKVCGLAVTSLPADERYPDSTFVEDTAILTERGAILTRPGAASRAGETAEIREEIARFFPTMAEIEAPGTLDGGDICGAGDHFFIGVSQRTNEEGARQLGLHLGELDYTSSTIDIREMTSILHLKSGVSYIGAGTLVVMAEMAANEEFCKYQKIVVPLEESYAANCVWVNGRILMAEGYPHLRAALVKSGFTVMALEMSEFQKMDGGLSCLSLRF